MPTERSPKTKLTRLTVSWSRTLEVEIDPDKIDDPGYIASIQNKAVEDAAADFNWKDGVVTDCEDYPEFVE